MAQAENCAKAVFPAPPAQQRAGQTAFLLSLTPARQATEHRCRCPVEAVGIGCLQEIPLPVIRKASRRDAGPLSRLADATFRSTFGAVNTGDDMELHCRTSYGEAIQSGEIADSRMLTLLCEGDEGLVGFAQLRWDGAPDCVTAKSPSEIQRLYVADAWHGKGIAQELMHACIEEAEARNSDVLWLGVWEHNPRAIAFYRKSGFVEVGEHVFPLGNDPQRDIVMAQPVAGSPSSR